MEYRNETLTLRPADPAVVRIVQITDTHLFADPAETYDGVDTAATLCSVIGEIVRSVGVPDATLLTGDLVEDAVPVAYERLGRMLRGLPGPVFCLPGNHDDPLLMRRTFADAKTSMPKIIDAGSWRIVLLDTWVAGNQGGGRLAPAEIQLLDRALESAKEHPALVVLHHPPVSIGSPWMDAMGLENGTEFIGRIDAHENVRAVIWGHIHQEFTLTRGNVDWYGTPSTCVQFPPGATEYALTGESPGYRELLLYPDGKLVTHVVRVS